MPPQAPEDNNPTTPAAPPQASGSLPDLSLGGTGSRGVAVLIDLLIVGAADILVYFAAVFLVGSLAGSSHRPVARATALAALVITGLIELILFLSYFILFEAYRGGKTPGKSVMKLRVLHETGRPITLSESLLRNLLRLVDYFPSFYIVGLITMAATERKQRLGDIAAHTLVVQDQYLAAEAWTASGKSLTAPGPTKAAPLTFVPHTASGAVDREQQTFRTARYGERDVHELIRILDEVEDERARARFRESIYISVFIWSAIVALLFLGPKYLWHPAQVRVIPNHSQQHEMLSLNAPRLPHLAPARPPVIDQKTLSHLRETERIPAPASQPPAPRPQPQPARTPETSTPPPPATAPPVVAKPPLPLPSAPQPTHAVTPAPAVPDAPAPQPSSGPFSVPHRPVVASGSGARVAPPSRPIAGGGGIGAGAQILSDTQGVDFTEWLRRFQHQTQAVWEPMLPQEIYPPLSKRGTTVLDITIGPDGTILHMKIADSTHDVALDKAAWGSIVSQDKLQPLPKDFHGPNIVLRCFYVVGDRE